MFSCAREQALPEYGVIRGKTKCNGKMKAQKKGRERMQG